MVLASLGLLFNGCAQETLHGGEEGVCSSLRKAKAPCMTAGGDLPGSASARSFPLFNKKTYLLVSQESNIVTQEDNSSCLTRRQILL